MARFYAFGPFRLDAATDTLVGPHGTVALGQRAHCGHQGRRHTECGRLYPMAVGLLRHRAHSHAAREVAWARVKATVSPVLTASKRRAEFSVALAPERFNINAS